METSLRWISGAAASLAGWFAPVAPQAACALGFVAVDFITGVAASWTAARRAGGGWRFESRRAWRTVAKAACVLTGIVMAWAAERWVLGFMGWRLDRLFTGFVCGVEFWSFLENAAVVSGAPLFGWAAGALRRRLRGEAGRE